MFDQNPYTIIIVCLIFSLSNCSGQQKETSNTSTQVGGSCEGCEAVFEYNDQQLASIDTLPEFQLTEPKIKLTGTVFQKDGQTPAAGVILYIYHTDREGIYKTKDDEKGWAKRHGYIRGWIKTGEDGQYTFYTFRPAAYPNGQASAHIHLVVKEPDKNEYYLDDFTFDDDPLLTTSERARHGKRGGSGTVQLVHQDGILTAKRDIILGLNIPDYE